MKVKNKRNRVTVKVLKDAIKGSYGIYTTIGMRVKEATGRELMWGDVQRLITRFGLEDLAEHERHIVFDSAKIKLTNQLHDNHTWAIKEVIRLEQKELDRKSFDGKKMDSNNNFEIHITKKESMV